MRVYLTLAAGSAGKPAAAARPYSQDLRDRVVSSVSQERRVAKRRLGSVSVFGNGGALSHRYRTTGEASARSMGSSRRAVLVGDRDWFLTRIAEKPDLTLRVILVERRSRQLRSHAALLPSGGTNDQKNLHAVEQNKADVACKRERWQGHRHEVDPRRLIVVDETCAKRT
jgi:transposase